MKKLLVDMFTGPDGQTYAIGRVYSAPLLIAGLSLPFFLIARGQALDLAAAGALFMGLGGAVWAMIRGTNATEPAA